MGAHGQKTSARNCLPPQPARGSALSRRDDRNDRCQLTAAQPQQHITALTRRRPHSTSGDAACFRCAACWRLAWLIAMLACTHNRRMHEWGLSAGLSQLRRCERLHRVRSRPKVPRSACAHAYEMHVGLSRLRSRSWSCCVASSCLVARCTLPLHSTCCSVACFNAVGCSSQVFCSVACCIMSVQHVA